VLALDRSYVRGAKGGPLVFHALPTPSRAEVADVTDPAQRTRAAAARHVRGARSCPSVERSIEQFSLAAVPPTAFTARLGAENVASIALVEGIARARALGPIEALAECKTSLSI